MNWNKVLSSHKGYVGGLMNPNPANLEFLLFLRVRLLTQISLLFSNHVDKGDQSATIILLVQNKAHQIRCFPEKETVKIINRGYLNTHL